MILKKYQQYFADFTRLSCTCAQTKSERAKKLREKLEAYFSDFPLVFDRWRKLGGNFNLFELAFKRPKETACTRILAWLLDAEAEHCQGNAFFNGFLELVDGKYWSGGQAPPTPATYSVETEVTSNDGRMDIVVRGRDFLLVVEAKIYTSEHGEQLKRYKQYVVDSGITNTAFVFLTVNGERSQDLPDARPLTWREISMAFQKVLSSLDAFPPHSPLRLVCRDFCRYINNF